MAAKMSQGVLPTMRMHLSKKHKVLLPVLGGIAPLLSGCFFSLPNAPEEHLCYDNAWEFSTPEKAAVTAPVVDDGVVHFGSNSGSVYALDAASGKKNWHFEVGSAVTSAPELADGILYVGSEDGQLYAINAAGGEPLWHSTTGGIAGSRPIANDGTLYVGSTDGYLYAFEAASGDLIWRFKSSAAVTSSPAAAEGAVYFTSTDGYLYAVGASNGKLLWRFRPTYEVTTSPAAGKGAVYVGSSTGYLHAVNAATGEEIWRYSVLLASLASPTVADDVVFFVAHKDYGDVRIMYAIDARNGELLWSEDLPAVSRLSPLVADGKVYASASFGAVYVLDAVTGKSVSRLDVPGRGYFTTPAVADEMVYAGGGARMYALTFPYASPSEAAGIVQEGLLEKSNSGPASRSGNVHFLANSFIAADGELVYFTIASEQLTARYAATGDAIWCNKLNVNASDYPDVTLLEVTNGIAYLGTRVGFLAALDATTGSQLWQSRVFRPDYYIHQSFSSATYGGVLYFVVDGRAAAYTASGGRRIWRIPLGHKSVYGQPEFEGGMIYLKSEDSIEVFDAASGAPLRSLAVGERIVSSPVVAEGTVYLGTESGVLALDSASGEPHWRYDYQGSAIRCQNYFQNCESVFLLEAQGILLAATFDKIYALVADDGDLMWRTNIASPTVISPIIADGVIYAFKKSDTLYALDAETGAVSWRYSNRDWETSFPTVAAVVDGVVFVVADGELYAIDVDGNLIVPSPQAQAKVPRH